MSNSPALACKAALAEMDRLHPGRSRASDGIMADQNHTSTSDHYYGNAYDLTHDIGDGVDTYQIADQLRRLCKAGVEHRVKYIISNRRICSAQDGWAWRTYDGPNPHDKHLHCSIHTTARNDTRSWWSRLSTPAEEPDMTDAQSKQLAEVHAMLKALVRPRRTDHADHDPNAIDLGDVLTKVEDRP